MDFIVYAFILIYCCTAIKVSIVLFIVCKILPKYILHSSNLYDLGNSPVAYNIVWNSHWQFNMYLLFQFNKNI